MILSLKDARAEVIRTVLGLPRANATRPVPLDDALGRVLAEDARADRDQPPFDRSTRDGFAVRAADVANASPDAPVRLAVIGEVPAGSAFTGQVGAGQSVEIMTGAPLPRGADAVVMVEQTARTPDGAVAIKRAAIAGEHVVPRGSELASGAVALVSGTRIDPAAIGLLASLGLATVTVRRRPRVAIVATGDELVEIDKTPTATQIRNSNRHSLMAQLSLAGAVPVPMPIAGDTREAIKTTLAQAHLGADLLLVSGGVSAGKHDYVEEVLLSLGARIAFDGVAIRPGRPVVFGTVGDKPFFGLPGNPLSTVVTFDLFVRPALACLVGAPPGPLRPALLPLARDFAQKSIPLHVFLPARFEGEGVETRVQPLVTQGSGDLAALAAADLWIGLEPGTTDIKAGSLVAVYPK